MSHKKQCINRKTLSPSSGALAVLLFLRNQKNVLPKVTPAVGAGRLEVVCIDDLNVTGEEGVDNALLFSCWSISDWDICRISSLA